MFKTKKAIELVKGDVIFNFGTIVVISCERIGNKVKVVFHYEGDADKHILAIDVDTLVTIKEGE